MPLVTWSAESHTALCITLCSLAVSGSQCLACSQWSRGVGSTLEGRMSENLLASRSLSGSNSYYKVLLSDTGIQHGIDAHVTRAHSGFACAEGPVSAGRVRAVHAGVHLLQTNTSRGNHTEKWQKMLEAQPGTGRLSACPSW